jgi:hypothetical protein
MLFITLGGFASSGKSTVAERLRTQHGFEVLSFAGIIKDVTAAAFGWDRELLEGATPASRAWRETEDTWWARELGMPGLTPRAMLQRWGTDLVRAHFSQQFWILALNRRVHALQGAGRSLVIADARTREEFEWSRAMGATLWRVDRADGAPEWFRQGLPPPADVHVTETDWMRVAFDATLANDADLDALNARVDAAVRDSFTCGCRPAHGP